VLATIYKRPNCYRLYWRARVDGKPVSRFKDFPNYSEAKKAGDKQVADLAKGKTASLSPGQASDALAAIERLQHFYEATGLRVSLLAGISEYCETATRLKRRTFGEAVDGYLNSVATIKRMNLGQAVEQFIEERKLKTVAREGKRPQLSPEHHYNTSLWLREFGKTFPGNAVSDLTKAHLDAYMQKHAQAAPKTRNERRGVVKMFLGWCVSKDYLPPTHRLLEAGGMKHEPGEPETIDLYTAGELQAMLARASKQPAPAKDGAEPERDYRDLLPVVALAGLAGLRFKEITRLDWQDVLGRPDHIEVKAAKSKTRSRRLIPICPSLAAWLEPYRGRTGLVWPKGYDMLHEDFGDLRAELEVPDRRNGLRHSFISAHFAAHSDENLTAAQAGNSPEMVHKHYKELLTRKEGEAWFAVAPEQAANVIPLPDVSRKDAQ
jgi:integrase